jgi:hypothetical protein
VSDIEEEEIELGPNGRPVRSAAKKELKYEERSSDDDIEDISDADSRDELQLSPKKTRKPQSKEEQKRLVVKLKMPPKRTIRGRTGSKSSIRAQTPAPDYPMGTRRSSRLSHEQEEPIIALGDDGRHIQVVRAGSSEPDSMLPHQTRGSKGLKKIPSAIMEVSQENSNPAEKDYTPGPLDLLMSGAAALVQDSEEASPAAAIVDDEDNEEARPMEGVVQESEHEAEDSDEGPITRGGRQLRVRDNHTYRTHSPLSNIDCSLARNLPKLLLLPFLPIILESAKPSMRAAISSRLTRRRRRVTMTCQKTMGPRASGRIRQMTAHLVDGSQEADCVTQVAVATIRIARLTVPSMKTNSQKRQQSCDPTRGAEPHAAVSLTKP